MCAMNARLLRPFASDLPLEVQYLVVAGGGGGGTARGGGGGAGGLLTAAGFEPTIGSGYTVTVGGGGAGGSSAVGSDGTSSVFGAFSASGGGGGGSFSLAGRNGGSGGGGGGSNSSRVGGTGTTGQGNKGGDNNTSFAFSAGGGGGAGAAAANVTVNQATDGGIGILSNITGTPTYYAGGGGGAGGDGSTAFAGTGGLGGGGNGTDFSQSTGTGGHGTANTGGGGGGAAQPGGATVPGGNGGSGVVILRYPKRYEITVSPSLTYTTQDIGRIRIATFTAGTGFIAWNAPKVSNADAQDWVNRVYANGGTVSTSTANAVNTFCNDIDAAGIRDRFARLNLFCGSNLNAALVPLYRSTSFGGSVLGNATDTNNAFVGVGTDYAETGASGGLTGNGTSKYLNTGFNVDQLPGAANCHLSSYIRGTQDIASARALIGTLFNGVADRYRIFLNTASAGNYTALGELGKLTQASAVRANANGGLLVLSRTSATSLTLYDDAVSIGTNTDSTAETTGASPFFVFARSGPQEYYNGIMAGYSIGAGMSGAEVTSYYNALNAFQTALGRAQT